MEISNKKNSKNTGDLRLLTSWLLVSPRHTKAKNLSIQISEIPAGSEQPMHHHEPEQCYYIIKGKGLLIIDHESGEVHAGEAIIIPSNARHGIKNTGQGVLEYLTVNTPAFSTQYEDAHWPEGPMHQLQGVRLPLYRTR